MKLSVDLLASAALDADPLPEVSQTVLKELLRNPSSRREDLLDLVKLDPSLCLKLLYLANSRSFGNPGRVASLEQMAELLDHEIILDALMSQVSRFSLTPNPSILTMHDHQLFWKHSLACARFSEALAEASGFPDPSTAYLAGLIHDYIKETLYLNYPDRYRAVFQLMEDEEICLNEAELRFFDRNHSDIAGEILAKWNVPRSLRRAVAWHHRLLDLSSEEKRVSVLAAIILAADILAYSHRQGDGGNAFLLRSEAHRQAMQPLIDSLGAERIDRVKEDLEAIYQRVGLGRIDRNAYIRLLADANRKLGQRAIDLRTSLREISLLHQMSQAFALSETLEQLLAQVLRELESQLKVVAVAILVRKEDSFKVFLAARSSLSGVSLKRIAEDLRHYYPNGTATLQQPHEITIETVPLEKSLLGDDVAQVSELKSSVVFSLDGRQASIGTLGLFSNQREVLSEYEKSRFEVVVEQIAMAIDRLSLNLETQRLAITDTLTGLFNRRHFQVFLEQEFSSCLRYTQPLSLVIMDLDHFKRVNDRYGHLVGDQVLRELGRLLKVHVREADVAARYGGEEFVVLMPRTFLPGATVFAERFRKAVSEHVFCKERDEPLSITLSQGVASFPLEGVRTATQLLDAGDRALLEAKRTGRDRIVVAPCRPLSESESVS